MTGEAGPPGSTDATRPDRAVKDARIALVGIDGSGKSTVAEALCDDSTEPPMRVIRCPDFHENACQNDIVESSSFVHLSRSLKAVGVAADDLAIPALKAASLYLRMTLCGPVETILSADNNGGRLLVERHPVVETLVYAPFYGALTRGSLPTASERIATLDRVLARAEILEPGSRGTFIEWCASEERRVGVGGDPWSIIDDLVEVLAAGTTNAVADLERRFRSTLPEMIVWLDVDPTLAAVRCRDSDSVEMHEGIRALTELRGRYPAVLDGLPVARSGTRVATIRVQAQDHVEEVCRSVRELVAFR